MTTTTTESATVTVSAPQSTQAPATHVRPGGTVPGDGSFLVGTDIAPGTYQTSGPASGQIFCYWERDRDASGQLSSIIANDNTQGQATVTVARSDVVFKTSGCQPWTKVR